MKTKEEIIEEFKTILIDAELNDFARGHLDALTWIVDDEDIDLLKLAQEDFK